MRKIEGMKLNRIREGKKVHEVPESIDFLDAEGNRVASISFGKHTRQMWVHQYGAHITIFEGDEENRFLWKGENNGTEWITTCSLGSNSERVFPDE